MDHLQRLSRSQARGGVRPHRQLQQPQELGRHSDHWAGSEEALQRMHGSGAASSSSAGTAVMRTKAGRIKASVSAKRGVLAGGSGVWG